MPITMFDASVSPFLQGLKGLKGVLAKAGAHAEAKKLDPNALLQTRLYPDMLPMLRQVQIACDFAKGGAGRLAQDEMPTYEDNEASFADLEARVGKTIAYLESLKPAAFVGAEDRDVTLMRRGESYTFKGKDYLFEQAMPNFWFHVTTAYALLRHNGVEVGKKDFLATA
jgi:hypothetical protein